MCVSVCVSRLCVFDRACTSVIVCVCVSRLCVFERACTSVIVCVCVRGTTAHRFLAVILLDVPGRVVV